MKNIITVPNIIIQNKDLSFTEKVIYALGIKFFLFKGEKHSRKISSFKKYLIKDLGLNKGTINKYVDILVEKNYMEDGSILLPCKGELYSFNGQDCHIFKGNVDMKFIGGFTQIPLKVLTSKELGWKDKAVYMALKRSWEKCTGYYCLNTIERFEEYNLTRPERNIANLKAAGLIKYEIEKGEKVNDQKITSFDFYGFEEESQPEENTYIEPENRKEVEVVEVKHSYGSMFKDDNDEDYNKIFNAKVPVKEYKFEYSDSKESRELEELLASIQ